MLNNLTFSKVLGIPFHVYNILEFKNPILFLILQVLWMKEVEREILSYRTLLEGKDVSETLLQNLEQLRDE